MAATTIASRIYSLNILTRNTTAANFVGVNQHSQIQRNISPNFAFLALFVLLP